MPRGRIYKHETKVMHLNLSVPMHALLMRWAAVSGMPGSRFVVNMLQDNMDAIEAMVEAAEAAKAAKPESLEGLKALLTQRINDAEALRAELSAQKKRGT